MTLPELYRVVGRLSISFGLNYIYFYLLILISAVGDFGLERIYLVCMKLPKKNMHEKIQRYKEKADRQNISQPYRSRDKGAR